MLHSQDEKMPTNEILLLKLIDANAELTFLLERGLSYSQIALLLKKQIESGYVETNNFQISLTNDGEKIISKGFNLVNSKKFNKWVLPNKIYYKKPLSSRKIYLPKEIL